MAMGRPRAFDADAALDEAMEVFWRHGYEGATIAQLTEAMGINPPSLYAAFGSKEGLLKAALTRYSARRAAFMDDVLSAPTARAVAERMLIGIADTQTDPANPPMGTAFYYDVTDVTGCGEGPLGFYSDGTAIPNTSPCLVP